LACPVHRQELLAGCLRGNRADLGFRAGLAVAASGPGQAPVRHDGQRPADPSRSAQSDSLLIDAGNGSAGGADSDGEEVPGPSADGLARVDPAGQPFSSQEVGTNNRAPSIADAAADRAAGERIRPDAPARRGGLPPAGPAACLLPHWRTFPGSRAGPDRTVPDSRAGVVARRRVGDQVS